MSANPQPLTKRNLSALLSKNGLPARKPVKSKIRGLKEFSSGFEIREDTKQFRIFWRGATATRGSCPPDRQQAILKKIQQLLTQKGIQSQLQPEPCLEIQK